MASTTLRCRSGGSSGSLLSTVNRCVRSYRSSCGDVQIQSLITPRCYPARWGEAPRDCGRLLPLEEGSPAAGNVPSGRESRVARASRAGSDERQQAAAVRVGSVWLLGCFLQPLQHHRCCLKCGGFADRSAGLGLFGDLAEPGRGSWFLLVDDGCICQGVLVSHASE